MNVRQWLWLNYVASARAAAELALQTALALLNQEKSAAALKRAIDASAMIVSSSDPTAAMNAVTLAESVATSAEDAASAAQVAADKVRC